MRTERISVTSHSSNRPAVEPTNSEGTSPQEPPDSLIQTQEPYDSTLTCLSVRLNSIPIRSYRGGNAWTTPTPPEIRSLKPLRKYTIRKLLTRRFQRSFQNLIPKSPSLVVRELLQLRQLRQLRFALRAAQVSTELPLDTNELRILLANSVIYNSGDSSQVIRSC